MKSIEKAKGTEMQLPVAVDKTGNGEQLIVMGRTRPQLFYNTICQYDVKLLNFKKMTVAWYVWHDILALFCKMTVRYMSSLYKSAYIINSANYFMENIIG